MKYSDGQRLHKEKQMRDFCTAVLVAGLTITEFKF